MSTASYQAIYQNDHTRIKNALTDDWQRTKTIAARVGMKWQRVLPHLLALADEGFADVEQRAYKGCATTQRSPWWRRKQRAEVQAVPVG